MTYVAVCAILAALAASATQEQIEDADAERERVKAARRQSQQEQLEAKFAEAQAQAARDAAEAAEAAELKRRQVESGEAEADGSDSDDEDALAAGTLALADSEDGRPPVGRRTLAASPMWQLGLATLATLTDSDEKLERLFLSGDVLRVMREVKGANLSCERVATGMTQMLLRFVSSEK